MYKKLKKVMIRCCVDPESWSDNIYNYIGQEGIIKQINKSNKETYIKIEFENGFEYWFRPAEIECVY